MRLQRRHHLGRWAFRPIDTDQRDCPHPPEQRGNVFIEVSGMLASTFNPIADNRHQYP
jgi:hypothetical protein